MIPLCRDIPICSGQAHHIRISFDGLFSNVQKGQERCGDCRKRVNILPLGAGALAGTTYNTDREFLKEELGFDGICENSLMQ